MAGLFRTASKQPNPLGTAIRTRGSGKYTFGLALSAGLAGLLYGYDTVSISGAIEFLRARYGLSTLMEGLVISSIMLGAVIGAATAGSFPTDSAENVSLLSAARSSSLRLYGVR